MVIRIEKLRIKPLIVIQFLNIIFNTNIQNSSELNQQIPYTCQSRLCRKVSTDATVRGRRVGVQGGDAQKQQARQPVQSINLCYPHQHPCNHNHLNALLILLNEAQLPLSRFVSPSLIAGTSTLLPLKTNLFQFEVLRNTGKTGFIGLPQPAKHNSPKYLLIAALVANISYERRN